MAPIDLGGTLTHLQASSVSKLEGVIRGQLTQRVQLSNCGLSRKYLARGKNWVPWCINSASASAGIWKRKAGCNGMWKTPICCWIVDWEKMHRLIANLPGYILVGNRPWTQMQYLVPGIGSMPTILGSAKSVCPSPPYDVLKSEKRAWYSLIRKVLPSHRTQFSGT